MSAFSEAARPVFTRNKVTATGAIVAVAALVPLVFQDTYWLGVFTLMFTVAILNISWNFLLGFGGVWNFGQLAVYAVGGYGAGIAILKLGFSPWLAIPVGGVAGAALAALIAFPALRLFGIYTALLTFSAAQVVQLVIQNDTTGLTGGSLGLPGVPGLFTSQSPIASARSYYWLCLFVLIVAAVWSAIALRSPLGLALRTSKESVAYGSARGIDVWRYRMLAFIIAGFVAGVGGALYTIYNGSMTPKVMGLEPASIYIAMLVIGGLGTISGPIVGTLIVTMIQQALITRPGLQLTVLGVLLLTTVVFLPNGVSTGIRRVWERVLSWADEDADDDGGRDDGASSNVAAAADP